MFKMLYRFWHLFSFIHRISTYSYIRIVFILLFVLYHILIIFCVSYNCIETSTGLTTAYINKINMSSDNYINDKCFNSALVSPDTVILVAETGPPQKPFSSYKTSPFIPSSPTFKGSTIAATHYNPSASFRHQLQNFNHASWWAHRTSLPSTR